MSVMALYTNVDIKDIYVNVDVHSDTDAYNSNGIIDTSVVFCCVEQRLKGICIRVDVTLRIMVMMVMVGMVRRRGMMVVVEGIVVLVLRRRLVVMVMMMVLRSVVMQRVRVGVLCMSLRLWLGMVMVMRITSRRW